MKNVYIAFNSEVMKLKNSKIFIITIMLFTFIPLMMGLLMYVAQHPESAANIGMIAMKASLFGKNDWAGYLNVINQIVAMIGLIGFGFITSWVFGREYMEKTLIDILALPLSRTSIVIAKFIVVFLWSTLLSLVILIVSLLIGFAVEIPFWSTEVFQNFILKYVVISFLTILLSSPVGFIASYGRGIIAPIGFVIITLITAQFVSLVGFGPYFPWAIPGVHSIPPGTPGMELNIASYIILILTSIFGLFLTIIWWKKADQH